MVTQPVAGGRFAVGSHESCATKVTGVPRAAGLAVGTMAIFVGSTGVHVRTTEPSSHDGLVVMTACGSAA